MGLDAVAPAPPEPIVRACDGDTKTAPPLRGSTEALSQALLSSVVCATTDIVVSAYDPAVSPALASANRMGAPMVHATEDSPFDASSVGAARVWTSDPDLVVPGDYSILPLPIIDSVPSDLIVSASDALETTPPPGGVLATALNQDPLIVVSTNRIDMAATAGTVARSVGANAIWATPGDMRQRPAIAESVRTSNRRILVGDFAPEAAWQTDVAARGLTLPGGGQVLFPSRRIVALYGHPHTGALGVLGEQNPTEAVTRAMKVAEPYATDDADVIPGFEIIATLASSSPGKDGDYSSELSIDDLTPWIDAATEAGLYVILDLQPGRTDFLTQARRYEELLTLPNVGLALDPEWRLGPDQTHLRQIGSVTAAEVNAVSDWLAALVRREALPQKLFVVHQFKLSMISDRSAIKSPSELATVIQMDGQGPLSTKYGTWRALLVDGDDNWFWGWKNFYDEDAPTATPAQVLDLDPVPVFVSYQ